MEPTCINLMELFGDRFKIGWDETYAPKGRPRDKLDPWYMQVLCRRGYIYPHCGTKLVAVSGLFSDANAYAAF